jgi:hypothetical protein
VEDSAHRVADEVTAARAMPDLQPVQFNSLQKILLKIAAVDEETLRQCPRRDINNVIAVGEIQACVFIYVTSLFALISHKVFAPPGTFRPELVLASGFLALFLTLVDSYLFIRSGWFYSGIDELKRGGLDIGAGIWARVKAGFSFVIRLVLSIGLAQLTAIFMGLILFTDINFSIQRKWREANASLIARATESVDAEIRRATEAVTVQTGRVSTLAAQIDTLRQTAIDPSAARAIQQEIAQLLTEKAKAEDDLRNAETFAVNELAGIRAVPGNSGQAGAGPRRRAALEQVANAKAHLQDIAHTLDAARNRLDAARATPDAGSQATQRQAHDQLPGFERMLAEENAQLRDLKNKLARLTQGRGGAIRTAVEKAPDYVPLDNGLLAQLNILEKAVAADANVKWFIILIDVVSFGFELAAVLAKVTSYVPTTYAMLIARDAYLDAVKTVNSMMAELNPEPPTEPPGPPPAMPHHPANDNWSPNGHAVGQNPSDDQPPPPPKRPRGRPRKNPPPAAA